MSTVVGVIPARYASTRLPGKPLVDLLGKTMVERVYLQARRARLLNRIVVATDDARIEQAVRGFGGESVMTPASIRTGSDRVAAVAESIEGDLFVNIQGDEPLIAPEMIDEGVKVVLEDEQADVGTLVRKISLADDLLNPSIVKVVLRADRTALYFSRSTIPFIRDESDARRWLARHTFYKHIGIYVFRRSSLRTYARLPESSLERAEKLEQLRLLENGMTVKAGTTEFDSIPIDTSDDVERVIAILKRTGERSPSPIH